MATATGCHYGGDLVTLEIAESEPLFFKTGQHADGWYISHLDGLIASMLDVPAMNGGVCLD